MPTAEKPSPAAPVLGPSPSLKGFPRDRRQSECYPSKKKWEAQIGAHPAAASFTRIPALLFFMAGGLWWDVQNCIRVCSPEAAVKVKGLFVLFYFGGGG